MSRRSWPGWHDRGQHVDETVAVASASLQIKSWVYLRDTRRYSIFMEQAGTHAYGAVGITDSIKELLGGSGALVETGLLLYDGRIVCDGLISPLAWIGPTYKRDFNEALSRLRAAGQFYTDHLVPRGEQESGSVGRGRPPKRHPRPAAIGNSKYFPGSPRAWQFVRTRRLGALRRDRPRARVTDQ
jgi:hypothetical protein